MNGSGARVVDVAVLRARALRQHFFRRFFDNDTLSADGDTERSVVRALCFSAVPGLMVAFWLLPCYPGRPVWAVAADRYFFVLFSFVAMGVAATFEWEMLFPDRADFLILLPLPLKAWELFAAKSRALVKFLAMFLVASNVFAMVLFPAVSTAKHSNYFHSFAAHAAAVLLAGLFASASMLAVAGLCFALLPDRVLRWISAAVQAISIMGLLLLFLLFPLFASHMQTLLEGHAAFAMLIPPLWYMGLYEVLVLGGGAPAGAQALAMTGLYAISVAVVLAVVAYPLAWARQKRRAMEGAFHTRKPAASVIERWLHRWLLRRPEERAIFHFVSYTVRRNSRYQVYLAIYSGVGLALAAASVMTLKFSSKHTLVLAMWNPGLHAVLPLLLFWLAVGLKVAFGFPVDMRARWVFSMNLLRGGAQSSATRIWVLLCCGTLTAAVTAMLVVLGWHGVPLVQQLIWGATLSLLLADVFFMQAGRIPFTHPRLPGRATLPITLVLYAAAFPVFVLLTVHLEMLSEVRWSVLLRVLAGIAALHLLLIVLARRDEPSASSGFVQDEVEDEFQKLGLSA